MATTLSSTSITMGSSTLAPNGTINMYPVRAWVAFNGNGAVGIRGSGNVTSITDNNTGDYTVNITTALADANYAIATGVGNASVGNERMIAPNDFAVPTSTACRVGTRSNSGSVADSAHVELFFVR